MKKLLNIKGKKIVAVIVLIILAVVMLATINQYRKFTEIKAEQLARIKSSGRIIETKEGIIEFEISGEGFPVLMLHGAGGGYDQGLLLADTFLPQDKMIIAISRFGYLGTPLGDNPTPNNQAKLYRALLEELGIKRVHVVAVSDGGPSALKFAINHPEYVESLTMICAKSKTPPELTKAQSLAFGTIFNNDFLFWLVSEHIRSDLLNVLGVSKEVQERMTEGELEMAREFFEIMNPISLRKAGIFNANVQFKELKPEDYPLWKIKAPTLVIHAEDDTQQPYYYAEYTHEKIPNSQLVSFAEGGHMFFGHHAEVAQAIKDFFENKF